MIWIITIYINIFVYEISWNFKRWKTEHGRVSSGEFEVYISDISAVPPETMTFLEEAAAAGIDLFMVDALSRNGHPTHMSLDEAIGLVRKLRPSRRVWGRWKSSEKGAGIEYCNDP